MENENSQLHYMQISVDHMDMMDFLTDEQRGIVFRLVFEYFRGEKTKEEITAKNSDKNRSILPIFTLIAKSIDRGRGAYEERCRKNRENGKKGGAPKGNQNARKRKVDETENNDLEEDIEDDYSSTTLAHWFNCLSTELNEAGTSFSAFFDFEQLCAFFAVLSFIVICFEPQPTNSGDMSFESYLQGGVNTFIHKCNSLGADAFLEEMRQECKTEYVNNALAQKPHATKEECEKLFDYCTEPTPLIQNTILNISHEES